MVLDPIPQSLPVQFFGSRPQPPTSPYNHIRSCSLTLYVLSRTHMSIHKDKDIIDVFQRNLLGSDQSLTCISNICQYTCTYVYTLIHIYLYMGATTTSLSSRGWGCVGVGVNVCVSFLFHSPFHATTWLNRWCTHTHTQICMYTCVYVYMYVCTHTYIYIYTFFHIHVRAST